MLGLLQLVALYIATSLRSVDETYGLTDERRALFGVSLGTLLASYSFTRDGIGSRFLGTIDHADIGLFARSYLPPLPPLRLEALAYSPAPESAFLRLLADLATGQGDAGEVGPMTYVDRVGAGRQARFSVGGADPVVRAADAIACARRFPDRDCRVVPGLGRGGDDFEGHARDSFGTHIGDWAG